MKKLFALVVLVAVVFVVWNRQRLYVRDPLGSVARDGVKESGAQVYINFSNDVLVENYHAPMYVTLVQHGERVGAPATLHCVAFVACLLDADVATLLTVDEGARVMAMSGRTVEVRERDGREMVVTLR